MLIIALVLAAIGLAALVFAVVTSNALVAWVCIGASLLGVLLLIADALRERRRLTAGAAAAPAVVESPGAPEDLDDLDDLDDVDPVDDVDTVDDVAPVVAVDAVDDLDDAPEVPATLGEALSGGFEADTAARPAD
ncbi:hypothetical protein [[Mycobacterium] crassicus]|uniref:Transmembrane protein n=1 Tax=[Mycobacterium] crassicus TaxID=2872309 RepID=A0ABU5XFB9_9MYCO|nr:hypothetical protein [Mycolicibacter sp. MYC098]MEB3020990.1 hypothetical protein [Mycolicibacter sp. MYC098]